MASIIAHELEEATTDPDLNAWYDRRGEENADKCAWTLPGATSTAGNGSGTTCDAGVAAVPDPTELGQRQRRVLRPGAN